MTTLRRRLREDRGSASTQLVLVTPALLVLALLIVQLALTWHARHIAQYAAQRGLAAARVEDGSAADGSAQARRSLAALGGRVLTGPSVQVARTSAYTTVRVDGSVIAVVPGLHLHASGTAAGATEKVTFPTGAQP
ncbi:pilus assembly protein [Streptomyces sp. NBC_00006]|uniref:TadE/TadG family type IV pilus assembly protein n=1 Tax=unclassified Streptomyces TaxID=2593676 RepID=UPI0022588B55|nr:MULTISPECIES: TadE/TadG family type IV pilus assembly protein [unclassified Streptomyces]MCX5535746.1 pilus assembly protein [Streptomyces sp. NBC_00006]